MGNRRDDEDSDDLGHGHTGSTAGSPGGSTAGSPGGSTGSGSSGSHGSGPGVGDTLKKLFTAGISAAFMTEESVRSFVSELKLPKEAITLVLQGAQKSKDQLMDRVGREVVGIISRIDFVKEASRFVEEHKFRITAEIEVTKRDGTRPPEASREKSSGDESTGAGSTGGLEFSLKSKSKS